MRPRVVVAVVAAVVFGTASGALVGGYLALPSDGVWAVTVGTEMAGFVPLGDQGGSIEQALSVEGLYRQVLGGTAAGALVGAAVGALLALALRAALRRRGDATA